MSPTTPAPEPAAFRLTFLGANATVTGSRYLVDAGSHRVLVDCGLFQGYKALRLRNWAPFPVDPASIDAVILTHAHLDHSGYLPRLISAGFSGAVWCTDATRDLCGVLLPDSGHLLEEEAGYANRKGTSRHHPAEPLYTEEDARRALRVFRPVPFDQAFEPVPGLVATLRPQGHILGASAVSLAFGETRITFSGDIGRPCDPVMRAPAPIWESDWLVVESTYGNRQHLPMAFEQELKEALGRVLARGGVAVIPAFAVGRAQLLLHMIAQLQARGEIPEVPVYLNSPMAADVTGLYQRYRDQHRLSGGQLQAMQRVTRIVNTVEQSKALNRRRGPMIIVAASGMATGGRVLHHLIAFAPDHRNGILLSGFQAGGTRGAALARGETALRIFGQDVPVRAEVVQLGSASAHADADEVIAWLRTAPRSPRGVFVTHGEPDAADALRLRIERELQWPAHVPEYGQCVDLSAAQ
ncbi:MBL fold metallo-hydrolase RNA specificity domain-containing protein [Agrilutibacter solisilvae]|uniref:MBL fold metallo-hydrolase n=1 Tax=Agrilutibacter solisilvae TaxID=2763317 RepID=A0A975ARE2_9GAMM|nr:MBL fold metallo-hydrolase [Lysobacter solisilvae]QSX77779.1 MBL fold metallo-hydrolase [Lysobacter solisilvae]